MTEYEASTSSSKYNCHSQPCAHWGGESSTPQLLDSITAVSEYWIARSSRAMTPSVGRTVSTPSFRAQRLVRRSFSEGGSNPESFRGGSLDCFAALAMTEYEAATSSSKYNCHSPPCAHLRTGAGNPVRRGLSAPSQPSLEYWIARSSRAMTASVWLQTRLPVLAAQFARALLRRSAL